MANKKVTALTENTGPASEDLLYSVDDPSGTPASRKVTVQNLLQVIPTRTVNTTPATSDYVVIIDDPAGSPTVQHITIENLLKGILTTSGDILTRNSGGTITRLPIGSPENVLAVDSLGTGVEWSASAGGGGGGAASMVNQYGGTIPNASVVIFDNSATAGVTMGSIWMDGRIVGVAGANISTGATASILVGPQRASVLTYGTVSIGDWLVHGTIEGQAASYGPDKPKYNYLGIALESATAAGTIDMLMATDIARQTGGAANGYLIAGYIAGAVSKVQKFAGASETWSSFGNKTPRATYYMPAVDYNDTTIYWSGGYNNLTQFSKYTIASDTGADTGAVLNGGRYSIGVQSDERHFHGGGASTWDRRDGFIFSSETRYWADTSLSPASNSISHYSANVYNKDTGIGYAGGAQNNSSYETWLYKITFPTTTGTVSAMTSAKAYTTGLLDDHASPVTGWFAGGYNGSAMTAVDKFPFSTETISAGTAMSAGRNNNAGVNTYDAGYHCFDSDTDKMSFSTETWSSLGAANSDALYASGGAGPFTS